MMTKFKKIISSPLTAIVLFGVAAALLFSGTIGGIFSAPLLESQVFSAGVVLPEVIGVTLTENGNDISWRNYNEIADGSWTEDGTELLLGTFDGEEVALGKEYSERLAVKNSGTMDTYVRIIIYKYWLDANGGKLTSLSPDLIDLNVLAENGWIIDERASTPERIILYYDRILPPGESTPDVTDTVRIDPAVASSVTRTSETKIKDGREYTVYSDVYDYNGVSFHIEAEADAVQTHNAAAAIHSAWGRRVRLEDGLVRLLDED